MEHPGTDTTARDHVQDGWSQLDDADLEAAAASLKRAIEASSDPSTDPEIIALGAALTALSGDPEAGRDAFMRAHKLAPKTARYLLQAAELELYSLDEPEASSELCDQVFEITTEEEELIDAVMLKAQALISLGDRDDDAREVLSELDGCMIGDPARLCQAADLHLTLGDIDAAKRSYQAAVDQDTGCADGWHGLGLVHQVRGARESMVSAWMRTRTLDQARPLPPWHLAEQPFAELATAARDMLPKKLRDELADIPLEVRDAPSEQLVSEGIDPRLLALLDTGDAFYLFQHNLERACDTPEQLLEELGVTLMHESAQRLGIDNDELAELSDLD